MERSDEVKKCSGGSWRYQCDCAKIVSSYTRSCGGYPCHEDVDTYQCNICGGEWVIHNSTYHDYK